MLHRLKILKKQDYYEYKEANLLPISLVFSAAGWPGIGPKLHIIWDNTANITNKTMTNKTQWRPWMMNA